MAINRIGRTIVLVREKQEALDFYRGKLGFEVTYQDEHFLHIGLPSQPGVGIWFLEATTEEQRSLVGRQAGVEPLLVMYTDDALGTHRDLVAHDVKIKGEPNISPGAISFHFFDLYGNEFVLVELKG